MRNLAAVEITVTSPLYHHALQTLATLWTLPARRQPFDGPRYAPAALLGPMVRRFSPMPALTDSTRAVLRPLPTTGAR